MRTNVGPRVCWFHNHDEPYYRARYIGTFQPSGNRVPLCVECVASLRAMRDHLDDMTFETYAEEDEC